MFSVTFHQCSSWTAVSVTRHQNKCCNVDFCKTTEKLELHVCSDDIDTNTTRRLVKNIGWFHADRCWTTSACLRHFDSRHWILVSGLRVCRPTWGFASLHDVIQWNTWVCASVKSGRPSTPLFSIMERVRNTSLFIPQWFINLRSPPACRSSMFPSSLQERLRSPSELVNLNEVHMVCLCATFCLSVHVGWLTGGGAVAATEHCSLFIVDSISGVDRAGCHLWLVEHEGLSETLLHVETELTLLRKWDVEDFTQQLVK